MKNKDQGFTLIELLVVIVIIGILAAIAIPIFLNQRKKGVDASLKSDLKNAATAVETWNVDNPTTAVPTGPASGSGASTALASFQASSGDTVKVKAGSVGAYTLCAYNAGASTAISSTVAMIYDSATGGLQSATSTCP
jgi:type IV pilus assembly protein PilA